MKCVGIKEVLHIGVGLVVLMPHIIQFSSSPKLPETIITGTTTTTASAFSSFSFLANNAPVNNETLSAIILFLRRVVELISIHWHNNRFMWNAHIHASNAVLVSQITQKLVLKHRLYADYPVASSALMGIIFGFCFNDLSSFQDVEAIVLLSHLVSFSFLLRLFEAQKNRFMLEIVVVSTSSFAWMIQRSPSIYFQVLVLIATFANVFNFSPKSSPSKSYVAILSLTAMLPIVASASWSSAGAESWHVHLNHSLISIRQQLEVELEAFRTSRHPSAGLLSLSCLSFMILSLYSAGKSMYGVFVLQRPIDNHCFWILSIATIGGAQWLRPNKNPTIYLYPMFAFSFICLGKKADAE